MKVRYYGHAGQNTGYGKAALGMCHALLSAGVELEVRTLAPYSTLKFEDHDLPVANRLRDDHDLDPRPDAVIVHTLPMDCGKVLEHSGLVTPGMLPADSLLIAYTTWEGTNETIAGGRGDFGLSFFDQIWVPSPASRFLGGEEIVMPHAFDEATLESRRQDAARADDRFRFYYVGAWTVRKNVVGLIRAYAHAFTPDDRVELVLRCSGATKETFVMGVHQTGLQMHEMPPVRFASDYISDAAMIGFHREMDCFVTASRGEAWNLPAFEALLAGRHVIAPKGQGSDIFLVDTSAALYRSWSAPAGVDVRLMPAPEEGGFAVQTIGAQGLSARHCWREPDLLGLAGCMHDAYLTHRRQMTTVAYDVAERFGYKAVGRRAVEILEGEL